MTVDIAADPLVWRTERFLMRPLEDADGPALLALFADPAVAEFMDIDPLEDLEEALGIIEWASERRETGLGVRWSIRLQDGGPLIGTCGFNVLEMVRGRRGEIAYDLARDHWGRGVMSEVLPHLLRFGYEGLGLHRIDAMVTPGNDRSIRLLERQGFVREARLRDYGYWKGRFWDQLVYARMAGPQPSAAARDGSGQGGAIEIRPLGAGDAEAVLRLYRRAAAAPGGLARRPDEIDEAYVAAMLAKGQGGGVCLGAWGPDGSLCGEIHAGRIGPAQFDHVLSDLTVAVDPDWQGRGIGARLFAALFEAARRLRPRVERVELMAREGNAGAVRLYQRLGFAIEGRMEGRVRLPDGTVEADLCMGMSLPQGD